MAKFSTDIELFSNLRFRLNNKNKKVQQYIFASNFIDAAVPKEKSMGWQNSYVTNNKKIYKVVYWL